MSTDRAHRLWRLHRLRAKEATAARVELSSATSAGNGSGPRPGHDFVFDRCANGQQLKCLTVVDEFTHECLAIDVVSVTPDV